MFFLKNTNFLAGFLFKKKIILFIWLHWVFIAVLHRLLLLQILYHWATRKPIVLYLSELNTFYSHKQANWQQFMQWGT